MSELPAITDRTLLIEQAALDSAKWAYFRDQADRNQLGGLSIREAIGQYYGLDATEMQKVMALIEQNMVEADNDQT